MESQESEKRRIVSDSLLDLSNSSSSVPLNSPAISKSNQYHDLPAPIYARELPPISIDTPETINDTTPSTSSSSSQYQPGRATQSGHIELDHSVYACSEKTMDNVTLSAETISNLYEEFVGKYHPFLPVVDVSRGPEMIYQLCPTLFWTIMAVASRRYDKDGELMMQLAPLLKSCLCEITISPVNRFVAGASGTPILNVASAYTVQAFLIYTMWPSLTSSLSADSSWNTAGIAMYSAIRAGLHCPGYARDFGRIKADNPIYPKISEQLRTWICCNIVSQTVATVYGFPAFTSFDASVLSACDGTSEIEVPDPIKQLMLIQHLEEEVAKTLNSNPKDPLGLSELSERLSLIQILSRKMDELERRLGDVDDCRKFVLLGARVHLLTYYYLDNGGYSELQLQKGMIQAYNSALALLEHSERAYSRDPSFFRYMPGIYAQILWQSSSIICKVFHSPFSQFIDGNAGCQLYESCVNLISKASILKHDMMYRAAEIMRQVWRLFGALARRNASSPRIIIRTRMSASVFFDCLWTMREEIGIRSVAPVIVDQRNSETDDIHEEYDDNDSDAVNTVNRIAEVQQDGSQSRLTLGPNVMTETESRLHILKYHRPFDLQYESAESSPSHNSSPNDSRASGRGRGRGGRHKPVLLRPAPAGSQPPFTAIAKENGINSADRNSLLGLSGLDPVSTIPYTAEQEHQNIMNGTEFLSWEADSIWRDVDSLMTDFGFREDEAPLGSFTNMGIDDIGTPMSSIKEKVSSSSTSRNKIF